MRYIFLIYSRETDRASMSAEEDQAVRAAHRAAQDEAARRGVLHGAQPLQRTNTATTVRMQDGKPGYYVIDCRDLDDAIEWAQKIPSGCRGAPGCIEIRPLLELPPR
jgi:hypothetical protein